MSRFTHFLLKYAFGITLLGFLISLVGGYYSVHLFSNLKTELEELLPTDARSVLDLNEVKSRLESTNSLTVLAFSDNVEASKKFVVDFAAAADQLPKDVVSGTEYRIDYVLDFFKQRRSLFVDEDDLNRIKNYVDKKIYYETQLYNPFTILQNKNIPEPRLDFAGIQSKYENKVDAYSHYPNGFYATADQKIRVILVNLPGQASGIAGAKKLRAAVDGIITKLNPPSYSPDLKIHFTGGVQDLIEENGALIEDLVESTIIVSFLVTIAMLIYFRSLLGTLALITSLLMGTACTFGIGFFEVGYLNANSAFMGSIVLGNGINFGIILLARFMEERRKQRGTLRSIATAVDRTFPATIVAAAAAGLSYGSLMLTSFRGFRQFGAIGLTGMALCWFSAYTLLPAYLVCFHRMGFFRNRAPAHRPLIAGAVAWLVQHFSKAILVASLIITVLSITTLKNISPDVIETDTTNLRNKHSKENGSIFWSKYSDQVFQRYMSPLVILPHNREDVTAIANEVRKTKAQEGKASFIVNVSTIEDFVPGNQEKKVRILREIRHLLPPRLLSQLPESQRRLATDLLSEASFKPFTEDELPELVKSKFREHDGQVGNLVLVEPSLSNELTKSDNLIHFVSSIRDAADKIHPGTAVAGSLPVTADMFESILRDGPKATLFAFVAVFLLIILLFRHITTIAQCSFALLLGVLWLFGFIFGFGEKINFLNFIALPITFGIGVDYGVNIFQRYRLEKSEGILNVLRHTGGAVMLASFTTIVGYGSLVIASNQAFVSFGKLAILGELTCVCAAIVCLPAFLWYLEERQRKKQDRLQPEKTLHEKQPAPKAELQPRL